MTLTELLNQVRQVVHDETTGTMTWLDSQYAIAISDGLRVIFDLCPESRQNSDGTLATFVDADVDNPDGVLWVPDTYRSALIEYAAYRYYDTDAGDTRDKTRGDSHLKRFFTLIGRG